MPWFRTAEPMTPLEPAMVRPLIAEVVHPRHFITGPNCRLEWHPLQSEKILWEVFAGRLLDVPMSRRQHAFESWNIYQITPEGRSGEPLLSVKFDAAVGEVHVVRAILSHAWETYTEAGNVIQSRETLRWVRERVGTIALSDFATTEELRDELICLLFQAVVGTSRLPLTSIEAPLPAFSFGELFYCHHSESPPDLRGLARRPELNDLEKAKLLETVLHVTPHADLASLLDLFAPPESPLNHLQALFNEVSLSPYTDLVDKALAWLDRLQEQQRVSPQQAADFLTRLLRLIGRHLTAFDLITFHHRGANYPDVLLLDAVLKATFSLARRHPDLFHASRLRRRGLRQGWLLRRRYEGLPVPDQPTSQGENQRVLPPPFQRVPEEQILHPRRRSRQLFAAEPLDEWLQDADRDLLRQCLDDLQQPEELRELGTALFLDRPLGLARHPLEPDLTPLLSYEAFSRSVASRRLDELSSTLKAIAPGEAEALKTLLNGLSVPGVPARSLNRQTRPGTASLADAQQVADDFLLSRTTPRSAARFWSLFPLAALQQQGNLEGLSEADLTLILGTPSRTSSRIQLTFFDRALQPLIEAECEGQGKFACRAGVEFPPDGLGVLIPAQVPWPVQVR